MAMSCSVVRAMAVGPGGSMTSAVFLGRIRSWAAGRDEAATGAGGRPAGHGFQVGPGGRSHGLNDVVGGIFQKGLEAHLGLGDDAHGTGGQGVKGGLGAAFRQGGADDDRGGVLGHDLAQEGKAIHARHFDVEDQDVGPQALHLLQGKQRVGGRGHHLDTGLVV